MEKEEIIRRAVEFIEQNYLKELSEVAMSDEKFSLVIDFEKLDKFDPELAELLLDDAERVIEGFNAAVEETEILEEGQPPKVRFTNLPETSKVKISNIRSSHIGKLIVISGIIRMATDVRPTLVVGTFQCPSCGTLIDVPQDDVKLKKPELCPSCGKRGRFKIVKKEFVDTQKITIEESPEALEGGEQPKRIDAFLKEDLVHPKMQKSITPGSKIELVGVVKETPTYVRGGESTRFDLFIEANNVTPIEREFEEIEITKEDEKKIRELSKDKDLNTKLINSVAPTIYGYDEIKESIVLQLFGGVRKKRPDGTWTRGDIHILLVGDPGTAKSQLLRYVSNIAPKARYVSGKGASGAGLTATVTKDDFAGGGWILEAGALPLTNKGIVCVDEIDKMEKHDTVAMHEAMEQQTISIAKANVHATLRCETTVLAAANPRLGRFDPREPLADQIDLPPPLINRFDLIYTIRDVPSKTSDEKLARYVLSIHENPEAVEPAIDKDTLRKYIAYAKTHVQPKLTKAAEDKIVEYFVKLRNRRVNVEEEIRKIPISPRQLEALIRMAEASARIRLSEEVTAEDAERAIRLLSESLKEVAMDETGEFDIDRVTGHSAEKRSKTYKVRDVINSLTATYKDGVSVRMIIETAQEMGVDPKDTEKILNELARVGEIYEPKPGYIKKSF
ncbi:AAA family ATPase [Nanoarchaeota archaeon]|nr:MAG: AAA family ATPase [Nanoarchaeota archaeon]